MSEIKEEYFETSERMTELRQEISEKEDMSEIKELTNELKELQSEMKELSQEYSDLKNECSELETLKAGTKVTLEMLKEKGILKTKYNTLKVLGNGKLTKNLTVVANKFTKSAEKAIVDAGGSIEVI